jgi:transketolase
VANYLKTKRIQTMINAIDTKNNLHSAPKTKPIYPTTIKDIDGSDLIVGCPKATRGLLAVMNLGAVNGGAACHWGGPAAMAESMSALHAIMFKNEYWFNHFNFVNDIGHAENGIYALRTNLGFGDLSFDELKGFRSITSKLTGHGESHLYPEGVLLSNGPLGSSVAQSQGLAVGERLKSGKKVTVCSISDGACMEGEAKEAFAAIPGLHKSGKLAPYVLLVSDNNTKLSGRISEDSFSMGPSFKAMETLGWNIINVENGNDLQECFNAISKAIELSKKEGPVCVILKTIKGYGVKSTEESASGGHGFPLKPYSKDIIPFLDEIFDGKTPSDLVTWANTLIVKPEAAPKTESSVVSEKAQAGFSRAMSKAVGMGLPVISVSSDLQGSTGLAAFHKEYPTHAIDIGIAESNMVGCAAGLSKAGFIPVVDTFAAFGVTKGNLPHIMAALSNCPIIAVYSHTGFQDAADGASHQSTTYLSAMGSIPHTKTIVVSCSEEAEVLMGEAIKNIEKAKKENAQADSYIFFVGRENYPSNYDNTDFKLGQSQVLSSGSAGVIAACGPMIKKAMQAKEELSKKGKEVTVLNISSTNDFDIQNIKSIVESNMSKLITIEDHQVFGGMGANLVASLKNAKTEFKAKTLGINGNFGQSAYKADELYDKNNLSVNAIIESFISL